MKTNLSRKAVLVVAAVAMAAPAFAGPTQAEREMSKQNAAGKAKIGTPARVPDWNSLEYREAMETGNLPSGAGVLTLVGGSPGVFTTVEYGGSVYRVGVDTP